MKNQRRKKICQAMRGNFKLQKSVASFIAASNIRTQCLIAIDFLQTNVAYFLQEGDQFTTSDNVDYVPKLISRMATGDTNDRRLLPIKQLKNFKN